MAGLGFKPECHTGIVLCNHLVEETSGLHREALAAPVRVYVPATFVVFFGVSA